MQTAVGSTKSTKNTKKKTVSKIVFVIFVDFVDQEVVISEILMSFVDFVDLKSSCFLRFVCPFREARGADGEENEVAGTRIGNPLGRHGRDENHIARSHPPGRHPADFDPSLAFENHVPFRYPLEAMPRGCPAGFDARPGDGNLRVVG